jgi:outer membrane receptor protein involved in Fe transport
MKSFGCGLVAAFGVVCPIVARAQVMPASPTEEIEVTATRTPEAVARVPADVTVISGDELRARHATDLRAALALVPGVEAPSGGDAGPASAVPSFWGLHEFDAFLLVVDGVPWGGAFNPSIPTLDLADVARIEVLKGSAPVVYGATAFVGVVQVIHNQAGATPGQVSLGGGEHGSARGQASFNLPSWGSLKESLSVDGESLGFAEDRSGVANGHALYRATMQAGPGELRLDADVTVVRTSPFSPVVRQGDGLTALTPVDANYNPANARIDENRYHVVVGYDVPTRLGRWESTVSVAYSDISDIRGFLRTDLNDDGSQNADSQDQRRHILDTYYDTHFSTGLWRGFDVVYGADLLFGDARQSSVNGAYYAPLRGVGTPPPTTALHVDEINTITDDRVFAGQYVQADWKLGGAIDITGGVRLNETAESRASKHVDGFDQTLDLASNSSKSTVRPTETLGISVAPWGEAVVFYGDVRESFKPSAIDFGPDYTPDVLLPERAFSVEGGVKGRVLDGRVHYGLEVFQLDFRNLVVATTAADGSPLMQNAGGERLRGIEGDLAYSPVDDLTLHVTASDHLARFTNYIASEGGVNVDAAGKMLPLSPRVLLGAGAIYTPARGITGSVVVNYVGRRYLDIANTAPVAGYATVDASVGYQFGRYAVTLSGTNLGDERPPVTASEFGDESFYRLVGRQVWMDVSTRF